MRKDLTTVLHSLKQAIVYLWSKSIFSSLSNKEEDLLHTSLHSAGSSQEQLCSVLSWLEVRLVRMLRTTNVCATMWEGVVWRQENCYLFHLTVNQTIPYSADTTTDDIQ